MLCMCSSLHRYAPVRSLFSLTHPHMAKAGKNGAEKRPMKVLAASQFHSSSSLKRHKNVQLSGTQSIRQQQEQHTIRFNPLSAPFNTFKTQKEAFEFLDKQPCSAILRTFAEEVSGTGKRVFIVATAEQFWQRYKALSADKRHHYEIIREAGPCNLYFDLEFCPQSNPCLDGPSLVQLLVSGIAQLLKQLYDVPYHHSYVLELDSSTPVKFSRHLIIRLPGLAFADCCHAGRFVRLVLLRLLQQGQHSSQCAQLLVRDKEGSGLTSMVDMGVYTRNRAFRLFLSSKFGKTTVLRLTPRFGGAARDPQAAFQDLLVSVLHKSSSSHSLLSPSSLQHPPPAKVSGRKQLAGVRGHKISLLYMHFEDWQHELQQLPPAWQEVAMLQLSPLPHGRCYSSSSLATQQQVNSSLQALGCWQQQEVYAPGGVKSMAVAGPATVHHGPSPYPLLEQFILSICTQGGTQGAIRSWVSMPASASVAFNMKNNRWCGNVERQHRSNGIYYIVDLAGGVYHQRCYDPECRNYRSNYMPLPTAIWHKYQQQTEQMQTQRWQQQQQQQLQAGHVQKHHCNAGQYLSKGSCLMQQQGTAEADASTADEAQEYIRLLQEFEEQVQEQKYLRCDTATLDEDELCLQLLQKVEQEAGLTGPSNLHQLGHLTTFPRSL